MKKIGHFLLAIVWNIYYWYHDHLGIMTYSDASFCKMIERTSFVNSKEVL